MRTRFKSLSGAYGTTDVDKSKPSSPKNVDVNITLVHEGIGFVFQAEAGDKITKEIKVYMSVGTDNTYFRYLTSIDPNFGESRYINNNLSINEGTNVYNFRFYAYSNEGIQSTPVEISGFELQQENYVLEAPSGFFIDNSAPNNTDSNSFHLFDDEDIIITWNPTGANYSQAKIVWGYKINVYKTAVTSKNLLRTIIVREPSLIYSLKENLDDGGPYSSLIFEFYTLTFGFAESITPKYFKVKNEEPGAITNLVSLPITGGVYFKWDENTENDLSGYEYSVKIEDGSWSTVSKIRNNNFTKLLTQSEIAQYGITPTIHFKVRSIDKYDQTSDYSEIDDVANTTIEDILTFSASVSSGTGEVTSTYSGVIDSGGISF